METTESAILVPVEQMKPPQRTVRSRLMKFGFRGDYYSVQNRVCAWWQIFDGRGELMFERLSNAEAWYFLQGLRCCDFILANPGRRWFHDPHIF
jgi:hypothetical protein